MNVDKIRKQIKFMPGEVCYLFQGIELKKVVVDKVDTFENHEPVYILREVNDKVSIGGNLLFKNKEDFISKLKVKEFWFDGERLQAEDIYVAHSPIFVHNEVRPVQPIKEKKISPLVIAITIGVTLAVVLGVLFYRPIHGSVNNIVNTIYGESGVSILTNSAPPKAVR